MVGHAYALELPEKTPAQTPAGGTQKHEETEQSGDNALGDNNASDSLPAMDTEKARLDENVNSIAREIRKNNQWRILDWKPKLLEKKTVYEFKLLNRKQGRVQVIEVDPAHPQLDSLGEN